MTNEIKPTDTTVSSYMHDKREEWCKRKHYLYDKLISMANLNDSKLSDSMEDNLEWAIERILKYGTYAENAKALRMYAEYFSLYDLLDI
jgi:hypothetical protein